MQLTRNGQLRHALCQQLLDLLCTRLTGLPHLFLSPLPIRTRVAHSQWGVRPRGSWHKPDLAQRLSMMRQDALNYFRKILTEVEAISDLDGF